MEPQEVKHYQVNGKYRVKYERSATKGIIGYTVEANGDDIHQVMLDAAKLREEAEVTAVEPAPEVK